MMKTIRFRRFNNDIETILNTSRDIRKLANVYLTTKLTSDQIILFLSTLDSLEDSSQSQHLETNEITSILKEINLKYETLPITAQLNLLNIICKVSTKNRVKILNVSRQYTWIDQISDNVDPLNDPENFIKAFQIAAMNKRLNKEFMKKLTNLIDSEKILTSKAYFDILKGILSFPYFRGRFFGELILKKISEKGTQSIEQERIIPTAFLLCSQSNACFHVDEEFMENLKRIALKNIQFFSGFKILDILKVYAENPNMDPQIFIEFSNFLLDKIDNDSYFWVENINKFILVTYKFRLKYPDFSPSYETLWKTTEKFLYLNETKKILNTDFFLSLNILKDLNKKILWNLKPFLLDNFNKEPEKLLEKFQISIILSPIDKHMENYAADNLKNYTSFKNFSLTTYIKLYLLICSSNLPETSNSAEEFFYNLEQQIKDRVFNFETYRDFKTILFEFKELLVNTKIWVKIMSHIIDLLKSFVAEGKIVNEFFLNQVMYFYTFDKNLGDKWSSLLGHKKLKISLAEFIHTITKFHDQNYLEPMMFILSFLPYYNLTCISHCLGIKISEPSFRVFDIAKNLIMKYNKTITYKCLMVSKNSLLEQIFLKGLSFDLKETLLNCNYNLCEKDINTEEFINLIVFLCQYGLINNFQARKLKYVIENKKVNNNEILLAVSMLLDEIPKTLNVSEYFDLQPNLDFRDLMKKINLWLIFSHDYEENEAFFSKLENFLTLNSKNQKLLVQIVEGITCPIMKNQNLFKRMINLLVDEIIENTRAYPIEKSPKTSQDLSITLSALLIKSKLSPSSELDLTLFKLESKITPSHLSADILTHLIQIHLKLSRTSEFLQNLFQESANKLNDSTFYSLSLKSPQIT